MTAKYFHLLSKLAVDAEFISLALSIFADAERNLLGRELPVFLRKELETDGLTKKGEQTGPKILVGHKVRYLSCRVYSLITSSSRTCSLSFGCVIVNCVRTYTCVRGL